MRLVHLKNSLRLQSQEEFANDDDNQKKHEEKERKAARLQHCENRAA